MKTTQNYIGFVVIVFGHGCVLLRLWSVRCAVPCVSMHKYRLLFVFAQLKTKLVSNEAVTVKHSPTSSDGVY